jgi:hypothetical protein
VRAPALPPWRAARGAREGSMPEQQAAAAGAAAAACEATSALGRSDAAASTSAAAAAAAPAPVWYDDTRALMCECFGADAFARLEAALLRPPAETCVRVNTLRSDVASVRRVLDEVTRGADVRSAHAGAMPEALLVRGSGPHALDVSLACGRELAVNRRCAEAVLRGADVYVPGVLGCTANVEEGMLVAVTAVVEPLGATSAGMTRGTTLPSLDGAPTRLLLGYGKRLACAQVFDACRLAPACHTCPCTDAHLCCACPLPRWCSTHVCTPPGWAACACRAPTCSARRTASR